MKKSLLLILISFAAWSLNAQQIDIIDIYVAPQGGSIGDSFPSDELPASDTVRLGFVLQNNLDTTLYVGDSLTFGRNFGGTLILGSLGNEIAPGATLNAFIVNNYALPDSGDLELCFWPLYNPYHPNTDETKGRLCKTFSIEAEDNGGNGGNGDDPNSVEELAAQSMNVYAGHNELVIEAGEVSGLTHVAVFDMTGKQVFNRNVNLFPNNNERFNMNSLSKGIYIVRLSQNNQMIKTDKVIFR